MSGCLGVFAHRRPFCVSDNSANICFFVLVSKLPQSITMVLIAFLCLGLWPASVDQEVDSAALKKGLVVDLDAERGVVAGADNRVEKWINQVESFAVKTFEKRDEGRRIKGSGMPLLKSEVLQQKNRRSAVQEKSVSEGVKL